MPAYSFGVESPIKFDVSDKTAANYNRAADKFYKAQTRFIQRFGQKWNPTQDPITPKWTKAEQKAWNTFAKIYNDVLNDAGQLVHSNYWLEDYLVKNSARIGSAVATTDGKWRRIAYLAVIAGGVCELLRGLK